MKFPTLLLITTVLLSNIYGQNNVPVFISGQEGYKSFRIPAIVKLKNGDLLAIGEGRVKGAADYGNVDIVMKRSRDKGRTWDSLVKLVDEGEWQAGNPAPVLDQKDPRYPQGRLFLFYNTGNNTEGEVRKGNGKREVWYKTSTDGGYTWTSPINISSQVKDSSWRSYANTPGHALQLIHGPYAGRIYVPGNHSAGAPKPRFEDYRSHGYYTDDHGEHFKLSESVPFDGSNEATAAEGLNGQLIMNMRNQKGDPRYRLVSLSNDGGLHWEKTYADSLLPDPVCEGAILNLRLKGKKWLAFSNAADVKERNNLSLRISRDGGISWYRSILIYHADKGNDPSAYSDIVELDKKTIGVLFERDGYSSIEFRSIRY